MNSFGRLFRISIFGESHGEAVGVTLDGVPAGLELDETSFEKDLGRRKSGKRGTTPRKESDTPHLLTGVFNGRLPFVWLVSVAGNSNTIQNGLTLYRNKKGDNMPKFHTNVKDMLEDVYKGTYKGHDLAANTQPTILDKNLKMPSTWKSSLALDLKLPGDVNLNIEGIYNKDFNSVTVTKLGMVEKEGGIRLPGEPEARTYWESGNIRNKDGETVNPYLINNTDDVDGYYASVSAQVSKTWGFGLSLTAAYTYSSAKNVIDGIGDQVTSAFSTNTFNKNGSNVPELGNPKSAFTARNC